MLRRQSTAWKTNRNFRDLWELSTAACLRTVIVDILSAIPEIAVIKTDNTVINYRADFCTLGWINHTVR